jgi:ABC-type sugar transport system permease subunit
MIFWIIQAMYPTLVMALVNSHHTFDQVYFVDSSQPISHGASNNHGTTTRSIAFALHTNSLSTGTTLEEAEAKSDPHIV